MMLHLVKRGYIAACADAYHLTYADSTKARDDFTRWRDAAGKLHADHPHWSGMGKLISDTRRMIDGLCEDSRVDSARVGIAGHSLGGKMAFYTGCLDERVKVILASDFGFGWEQSNWDEPWYWNGRVKELEALGLDASGLPAQWLGQVHRTDGGGVETMEICGVVYQGTTLRKLLGLRSTAFTMESEGESIKITTRGYGHRVGMSQYGADAMAASGVSFEEILRHYYQGTVLTEYSPENN